MYSFRCTLRRYDEIRKSIYKPQYLRRLVVPVMTPLGGPGNHAVWWQDGIRGRVG